MAQLGGRMAPADPIPSKVEGTVLRCLGAWAGGGSYGAAGELGWGTRSHQNEVGGDQHLSFSGEQGNRRGDVMPLCGFPQEIPGYSLGIIIRFYSYMQDRSPQFPEKMSFLKLHILSKPESPGI